MKRISVVAVIVLFGVLASYEAKAQGAQDPVPIPAIRQQYATINRKTAKYRKVKKELLGFSAEGGELVAYLSDLRSLRSARPFMERLAGPPTNSTTRTTNSSSPFGTLALSKAAHRQGRPDDGESLLLQRRQTDQMDR